MQLSHCTRHFIDKLDFDLVLFEVVDGAKSNIISMFFRMSTQLRLAVNSLLSKMKSIVFGSMLVGLWLGLGFNIAISSLITLGLYSIFGGWRFLRQIYYTLPRDVQGLYVLLKLGYYMKGHKKACDGIPTIFYRVCDRHPEKTCFIDVIGDRRWSFREVDEYSNQVANYFSAAGVVEGESVGIFLESSAQYVSIWLGLVKIGACPALLNYNLTGGSLAHCMETARVRTLIYTADTYTAVEEAVGCLETPIRSYYVGDTVGGSRNNDQSLSEVLQPVSKRRPPAMKYDFNAPLVYIYTSGTTGLPKAAKIVHSRFYYMASTLAEFGPMSEETVIYDPLPLYHSAGGILGVGQALIRGSTVVIRKKFSASNFWTDCIRYKCTAAQYIGEICRYLLAQPEKPEDHTHSVRMMYGNGLRPQIWMDFQRRFNITKVTEFYGSTEGNAQAINSTNKVGCVGFTSVISPSMHPLSVILVDKVTGQPLRGNDGLCIRAPYGEPGELIGKINNADPIHRFDGYSSSTASNKKVARDVFVRGDAYFLTGDVLTMDEFGYIYFKDRTGDTFRWKGENVSTAEVEATVSNVINKKDAVVYGVEIPGMEGRTGMVAIEDPSGEVDITQLYQDISRKLPAYARPLFVRLLKHAEKTSTYKLKKVEIREEGYNPEVISDPLYYYDSDKRTYASLTNQTYALIQNGTVRF